MSQLLRIGDLVLSRRLGHGAWGEVWSAHRGDRRVAVKIVVTDPSRMVAARLAFDDELRAMARADHPNVVALLDQGTVPEDAAPELHPGAPYLVMAHADGGVDVDQIHDALQWRAILDAVLAGLAHLHARGLIHRDVKPANVLIFQEDGGQRYALSDLGLAWGIGDEASHRGGTPGYMAPEQAEGRWRELGPAADLYSVGVLAHVLATARLPGKKPRPRFPLPPGADAWIERLLAPNPKDRFATAAHARAALGLQASEWADPVPVLPLAALPTAAAAAGVGATGTWTDPSTWTDDTVSGTMGSQDEATWEAPLGVRASIPRAPPGLGLFGLREAPLTGRENERAALWAAFLRARGGAPTLVAIRGEVGTGKRRLARWLGEAVAEAGLATTWTIQFSSPARLGTGLKAAFDRYLRVTGQEPEVWPDDLPPRARAARVLQRWTDTPVVWLDDVAESEEAAALVELWTERGDVPALLLVATHAELPWPGAQEIAVGPLPTADLGAMLERWLALDVRLAYQVARRTGGNPQFAVQLIGDWVRRGLLVPGAGGFELTTGVMPPIPDSVAALWGTRLTALGFTDAEQRVAWAAAVLGDPVDDPGWAATAWADPQRVKSRLLAAGLASAGEDGLRLVSTALRESLVRAAESAGAADVLHRRAAAHLKNVGGDPGRIGHHLAEAGDLPGAIPLLVEGAAGARARSEFDLSASLARKALAAMDTLGVPHLSADRAWAHFHVGKALIGGGQYSEARPALAEAAAIAELGRWWAIAGRAHLALADTAQQAGELDEPLRHLAAAELAYLTIGDPELVHVLVARAVVLTRLSRGEEARAALERADAIAADGDPAARAAVLIQRGNVHSLRGEYDRADEAYALAERLAGPTSLSRNSRATIAAQRGDIATAEKGYRELIADLEATGRSVDRIAGNLMQVVAFQGRFNEARALADTWVPRTRRSGRRLVLANTLGTAASIALAQSDFSSFDRWGAEAEQIWRATRRADPDVAGLLESAAANAPSPHRERALDLAAACRRFSSI